MTTNNNSSGLDSLHPIFKGITAEIATLLTKIDSKHSGYIAETVLQLLPETTFIILSNLVIGKETLDSVREFAYSFIDQIEKKLRTTMEEESVVSGMINLFWLINMESLRRKGYVEYHAGMNLFQESNFLNCSLTTAGRNSFIFDNYVPTSIQ